MSDPRLPEQGFRWVEPTAPAGPVESTPRRRWWWVLSVAAVVVAVVAAGGVLWWRHTEHGGDKASGPIGTPAELLIPFSLARQPVQTWKVSAADIGLPPGVHVGWPFASSGDRGYFLSRCESDTCDSGTEWVYGLNLRTGERLFAPIQLDEFSGQCFGNGPTVAVCIHDGDYPGTPYPTGFPHRAWVIDLEHGAITYTGPTELYIGGQLFKQNGPVPTLYPVGNYRGESRLVATVEGKGVYGVGPHAELTWFAPGNGALQVPVYGRAIDIPPVPVAAQSPDPAGPHPTTASVFSVIDGTDLTPQPPEGLSLTKALVYHGGFAYEFTVDGGRGGLLFYDNTGKLLARQQPKAANLFMMNTTWEMPIALQSPGKRWQVYTPAGKPVLAVPATTEVTYFRVIGTRLYVQTSPDQSYDEETWASWDLKTGETGPPCHLHLTLEYIGSDGSIVIEQNGPAPVRAVDPTTCQTLWETTKPDPNLTAEQFIKVGPHLIQTTTSFYGLAGLGPAT